jgi:AcrR family transcriptional regulator
MATRLRQSEKRARTREEILAAARKVFGRRGYHGASLEEIAEQAGYSTGALYYNFAGKGALFLALLDERIEERIAEINRAFAELAASPAKTAAQAEEAARHATRTFTESTEWRLLTFEYIAVAARDPKLKRQVKKRFERVRDALTALIDRRSAELGLELPLQSAELATAINALGNGLALDAVLGLNPRQDLYGDVVAGLLRGLTSES